MKAILRISLLFLLLHAVLVGSQLSVRSHQFTAKSYLRETNFQFAKGKAYPIFQTTERGHYVLVKDSHDVVLFVPQADDGIPARVDGANLEFWDNYTFQADRAYLVFPPTRWYRVISKTEETYKIEYTIGDTKMHCSVGQSDFVEATHIKNKEGLLVSRLVEKPQDAICVLEFSSGVSGTGFLLYDDNKLYCYTNQHVAMNVGRLRVSLIDGSRLEVGEIQIAEDVDLARIEVLTEVPGFEEVAVPVLKDSVQVLGNSFGSGRITTLSGKVSGLNLREIETTAKFVSGNSGSPILNEDNAVIGVAAWVEHFPDHKKISAGSIFEDGRRVGVRIDREIEWVPVEMGQYVSRNRLILQTMDFVDELPDAMVASISDDTAVKMALPNFRDPVIKQWLKSRMTRFQAIRKTHKAKVDIGVERQGKRFMYTPAYAAIEKEYTRDILAESEKYWNSLQQKIVGKRRSIARATPYPDTEYLRTEIERTHDMLEAAEFAVSMIEETHREYAEDL